MKAQRGLRLMVFRAHGSFFVSERYFTVGYVHKPLDSDGKPAGFDSFRWYIDEHVDGGRKTVREGRANNDTEASAKLHRAVRKLRAKLNKAD
jgi:hypothetical protein